jgi:acetylornithine deacetylase/succinyl-diaminopimelate desuccinylase-like protein
MTTSGEKRIGLSSQQAGWLEKAYAEIDEDRLLRLIMDMVNIPSPTGKEGELAQFMVEYMEKSGLDASYQRMDECRGNAIGRLWGSGEGPELLFYGHLDTSFTGDEAEDFPVTGGKKLPVLRSEALVEDGNVIGLGVGNPKGPSACAVMALEAVRKAGIPLKGSVTVGLTSGGIHKCQMKGVMRAYEGSHYEGLGIGCYYMLRNGVWADFAVSTKPGYFVSWEEPGLCWFKVQVKGVAQYVGLRHVLRYKNPIVEAAKVIAELENWFQEYTQRNTAGLVAPQASIGSIEAGWPYKPEFIPAICNLYMDVRVAPHTEVMEVKRQFAEAIDRIRATYPDLEIQWEMYSAMPGSRTNADNWIIQSAIRAWEHVERRKHVPGSNLSGTSDTNLLRWWGIPTARLGGTLGGSYSAATKEDLRRLGLLDTADIFSLDIAKRLVQCYVYIIIDTCTRTRSELQ